MTTRVLVVDDDPVQSRLIEAMLRRLGHEPLAADNGEAAVRRLSDHGAASVDCMVLALAMPGDAASLLARLRALGIDTPVIVQAAPGAFDTALAAVRAGASDFVAQPVGIERLQVSLANALAQAALKGELRRMRRSAAGALRLADLGSRSPHMVAALKFAEKAATSNAPLLLEGEAGVGKAMLARAIHASGERRDKPFVAVHCATIAPGLVETTLSGRAIEADGGTLFLDEVRALPAEAQSKLARLLHDGGGEPDLRVIASTRRGRTGGEGGSREDPFARSDVLAVAVPPLRERAADIPDLVRAFTARFAAELGRTVRTVSEEALALLGAHRWPGNVRQLENAMFRAVALADRDTIGTGDFPQLTVHGGSGAGVPRASTLPAIDGAPAMPAAEATSLALLDAEGRMRPLDELEAEIIRFAILRHDGRMSEVARRLKIGRSTLYRKLGELGLDETTRQVMAPDRNRSVASK